MPQYVLLNGRSGEVFGAREDSLARYSSNYAQHADHNPRAFSTSGRRTRPRGSGAAGCDADQVASIRAKLPPDSILEPVVPEVRPEIFVVPG